MPESRPKSAAARPPLPTRTARPLSVATADTRVEAPEHGSPLSTERRNPASRQSLVCRITVEYEEMRGLCLTAVQAQRLFGLREDICTRVFNTLVDAAVLRRDKDALYRRNDGQP
jgi:hypothetical protein